MEEDEEEFGEEEEEEEEEREQQQKRRPAGLKSVKKGRKKMCSPGWPRTRDPPASASFSKSYRCAPPQPASERRLKHLLQSQTP